MRTTVDIDDDLLRRAKEQAARSGRTLTSVLEDGLRLALAAGRKPSRKGRVRLPVSTQKPGLCPGVDLDSWAGLLDVMGEDRGPS